MRLKFQSTLSARRATFKCCNSIKFGWHFNPRSPRGERLLQRFVFACFLYFNPRSPRGERLFIIKEVVKTQNFNPRSPRGERHIHIYLQHSVRAISIHALREESDPGQEIQSQDHSISIHALREESDSTDTSIAVSWRNFNPRSPRGERLDKISPYVYQVKFQSTLSARRATVYS